MYTSYYTTTSDKSLLIEYKTVVNQLRMFRQRLACLFKRFVHLLNHFEILLLELGINCIYERLEGLVADYAF